MTDAWQTIDSAPKDGDILGCARGDHGEIFYGVIQWANPQEAFPRSRAGWFGWPFATPPTHWQTLPTPPEITP